MAVLQYLSEILLLVVALSLDSFVASFAYGSSKIKIPASSAVIISVIGCTFLGISLCLGSMIKTIIPSAITSLFCFTLLFILGVVKLYDSSMKALIKRGSNKPISITTKQLTLILQVYATPTKADCDRSNVLSPREALSLAIALSLDSLAAGLGVGLSVVHPIEILLCTLIANLLVIAIGSYFGEKLSERLDLDLSWLSGVLLIILAILKIV